MQILINNKWESCINYNANSLNMLKSKTCIIGAYAPIMVQKWLLLLLSRLCFFLNVMKESVPLRNLIILQTTGVILATIGIRKR